MIKQYITDWHMTLLAFVIAFIYYLARRKKYSVTWTELFIIAIILAIGGTIGNSIASIITQGTAGGRRAYGMVLCNTITLTIYSLIIKCKDGRLTDYAAIPAAAICCVGKSQCIIEGCCYGIELFQATDGTIVRFPSQVVEELSLIAIVVLLMILERKGSAKGFLWSLHVLWYGISRYIADLFRGVPSEREAYLLGIPAGQFWSIILIFVGLFLLNSAFKRKYGRNLENKEMLNALIGKYPAT